LPSCGRAGPITLSSVPSYRRTQTRRRPRQAALLELEKRYPPGPEEAAAIAEEAKRRKDKK
jgi:hypothetical protein